MRIGSIHTALLIVTASAVPAIASADVTYPNSVCQSQGYKLSLIKDNKKHEIRSAAFGEFAAEGWKCYTENTAPHCLMEGTRKDDYRLLREVGFCNTDEAGSYAYFYRTFDAMIFNDSLFLKTGDEGELHSRIYRIEAA